jgi:hypothetical protein
MKKIRIKTPKQLNVKKNIEIKIYIYINADKERDSKLYKSQKISYLLGRKWRFWSLWGNIKDISGEKGTIWKRT